MSVRDVIAQGPIKPPRRDNQTIAVEFEDGSFALADPDHEGAWIVFDGQHVWRLEDLE